MKYIIVSGCSYTAKGHSWKDEDGKYHVDIKWAEHLKNMIDPNAELINVGQSGAGNEYIYTSLKDEILKIDPKDILLVMAAWSGSTREDWKVPPTKLKPPKWEHDNFGNRSNRPLQYHKDGKFMDSRTINWRWSLQRLAEQLDFKYLEVNMLNNVGQDFLKVFCGLPTHPMYKLINPMLSLTECYAMSMGYNVRASINDMVLLKGVEDRVSEEDSHPNAQGHKKIAEWIYDEIQRLGH